MNFRHLFEEILSKKKLPLKDIINTLEKMDQTELYGNIKTNRRDIECIWCYTNSKIISELAKYLLSKLVEKWTPEELFDNFVKPVFHNQWNYNYKLYYFEKIKQLPLQKSFKYLDKILLFNDHELDKSVIFFVLELLNDYTKEEIQKKSCLLFIEKYLNLDEAKLFKLKKIMCDWSEEKLIKEIEFLFTCLNSENKDIVDISSELLSKISISCYFSNILNLQSMTYHGQSYYDLDKRREYNGSQSQLRAEDVVIRIIKEIPREELVQRLKRIEKIQHGCSSRLNTVLKDFFKSLTPLEIIENSLTEEL